MGLDFEVIGVTLSKRKVEQKGLQHFINNSKYRNQLKKTIIKDLILKMILENQGVSWNSC